MPAAAVAGPVVMVVAVTGSFRTNVSKSSLNWHTSVAHYKKFESFRNFWYIFHTLHIVREHEDPRALEDDVKYVKF